MASENQSGQYLTFQLDNQVYGVPISSVREINRMAEITPVPRAPVCMAGVMNLRGKVIPVMDLRLKLGMAATQSTKATCIVVVESQDGNIGVIVDQVNSVIELSAEKIEKSPQFGASSETEYVLGMGKLENNIVVLIDILMIVNNEQIAKIKDVVPGVPAA